MERVKADPSKVGIEESAFPCLCETCLGDSPYTRMIRLHAGAACHICARPYTRYRWKAGSEGRFKNTVICMACAQMKHVCQCCMLDLTYGVPVEVRDKALAKAAAAGAISTSLVPSTTQATSDVNRQYAIMQAEAARAENGGAAPSPFSTLATAAPQVHAALMGLGRHKAHYERNAAKLCSFFARGECTRGAACPYRHEMPKSSSDPLSKQSYEDRYYGTQDPVAAKLLARMEGREQAHSASSNNAAMDNDPAATTLWVGGVTPDSGITSDDLTSAFYAHGTISSVHIAKKGDCAFVEFATHDQALAALRAMAAGVGIRGALCKVAWSRGRGGGASGSGSGLLGASRDADAVTTSAVIGSAPAPAAAAAAGATPSAAASAGVSTMPPEVAMAMYQQMMAAYAAAAAAAASNMATGAAPGSRAAPPASAAAWPSAAPMPPIIGAGMPHPAPAHGSVAGGAGGAIKSAAREGAARRAAAAEPYYSAMDPQRMGSVPRAK